MPVHHAHAEQAALLQRRSDLHMGENEAWQPAVVLHIKGCIVAHDVKAFALVGDAYVDYRA